MAKKELVTQVKLQLPAGKATPAPPVGPALGQHGLNIMDFVKKFNDATADKGDTIIPVLINVYKDRSFDFILKTPPASVLIKKALGIQKGSSSSLKVKVGKLSKEKLEEIAKIKMPDLNTKDLHKAMKIIAGTAVNMGVEVQDF
ncbi:MAG: 50S ribosomal protein L11 [Desulfurella sp.]|jgi:large subunit ribosomal protein L11|uniref:Large ribosomal subunit protein uL11 n=1 Tax=Desulfurella multipotens TaxID=79269 RepID=A0A1G6RJ58_9BACT|nr:MULTISPECIES: 50S ribosomal protein L11 [Desulfurella]AHF96676.1 50S ribosomal protein L11 [Desulfurella acetivorans A63]HEX14041.1 50S ribosomal protein L11 [Desulfurella acetivorans]PMP67901.1 MAG: 50S ribosomal protein L11 [Desulfurella multipotens]PMP87453.1 MAG: 50S ribosomal protein L11 [Desulfurella sp.]SDD04672.1 LSU ribosomal protein L11P [Desulfurella multipotens]